VEANTLKLGVFGYTSESQCRVYNSFLVCKINEGLSEDTTKTVMYLHCMAKIVTVINQCLRSLYLYFYGARNFVNLLRIPGIDSQPGGIDFFESIPGLLKIRGQSPYF
jgi:hypothetical protein